MVGSQSKSFDRRGTAAPASAPQFLSGVLFWVFSSFPATLLWSSTVVASFVWLLLNDQLHPALIYCLQLFLTA